MEIQIILESVVDLKQERDSDCDDDIKTELESNSHANSDIEENEQVDGISITLPFTCDICSNSYSFASIYALNEHKEKNHGILNESRHSLEFQCTLCPKSYDHNKKLTRHMKINHRHEWEKTKPYRAQIQCPLCPKSFTGPRTIFVKHLQKDHAANPKLTQGKNNKFHCPLCPKYFGLNSSLNKHVVNTHVEHKPFECQICKSRNRCKSFMDQRSLDKHMTEIHKPQQFRCEICLKKFTHSFQLNKHRKTHLGVSKVKCQHCFKTFSSKSALERHLVIMHKEANSKLKTYTCELCGKNFISLWRLENHVADAHVVDKSVECEVCGKMFVDKSDLANHLKIAHKKKSKLLTCDVCSKGFGDTRTFARHLKVEHGRFFKCSKCSRSFETKTDLDQHSEIVSDSPELRCDICLVFLPSPCLFDIHTKSHEKQTNPKSNYKEKKSAVIKTPQDLISKEKPFKCDLCTRTFDRCLYLALHRKEVHPGSKWQCKVCSKIFQRWCELTRHESSHSLIRTWECQVCQKTFRNQWDLTYHKKIHDEVKPHKCLLCNKSYVTPRLLRLHMGNHHGGEKPFKCHLCDKSWVLKSHLQEHILTHVEDRAYDCDQCGKCFKTIKQLKNHRRKVHLKKFKGISKKLFNSNDDSLVFVCSLCDFKTNDEKEVALHNNQHCLPKVFLSKAVFCSKHKISVLGFNVENTSSATSIANNSDFALVKTKSAAGGEKVACSLCTPVN